MIGEPSKRSCCWTQWNKTASETGMTLQLMLSPKLHEVSVCLNSQLFQCNSYLFGTIDCREHYNDMYINSTIGEGKTLLECNDSYSIKNSQFNNTTHHDPLQVSSPVATMKLYWRSTEEKVSQLQCAVHSEHCLCTVPVKCSHYQWAYCNYISQFPPLRLISLLSS